MRLLWKEWQQQKWIILLGCLAGMSFPAIECISMRISNGYYFTNTGSGILLVGGVLFAIILAVAATHQDIREGVDSFWQSKPIKPWKLFAIKFLLAAFLLGISCLAVISLDLITGVRRNNNFSLAWTAFCYTYPLALLLFAVSMFLMVVTRNAAKAAFLAIWMALLIYFLPLMFRGLEWMNVFENIGNANQRPSIVEFLIWLSSMPEKINPGMALYRPSGIPVSVYQVGVFQTLFHIIGLPDYLRYLLFVFVCAFFSILCVVLSTKAARYNWQWHPGQKSIVWAIGISAAAIFGVSVFQVGNNLEPVKEFSGKPLINPVRYDWNSMPASLQEGLPEGYWIGSDQSSFGGTPDVMYVKDDLMFRFTMGYQSDKGVDEWNTELIRHFVLQVYQFPYSEKNSASSDNVPDFVVGAMKFFQTEPVIRRNQQVLGCFIRGDRLYAAYRPEHKKGEHDKNHFPGSLTPMYFVTFDISDPTLPKVVSNMELSNSDSFSSGMADIDGYCYITDSFQLIILSVENPDRPEIVGKVAFKDVFANMPEVLVGGTKKMEIFPSGNLFIQENKLICWSQSRVTLFDIHDKLNPRVVYDDFFYNKDYLRNYRIQEVAFRDNLLYAGTSDGIYILSLESDKNGVFTSRLNGERRTTPLEKMAGRKCGKLILSGNYLIEQAGSFGVLVYDISNPSKPRRVYHAPVDHFANDIGFWKGLLYIQEYYYKMSFYELPKNID